MNGEYSFTQQLCFVFKKVCMPNFISHLKYTHGVLYFKVLFYKSRSLFELVDVLRTENFHVILVVVQWITSFQIFKIGF